ncbi:zinc dependent phospholipase C family protein [Anaerocolumna cellulosilytica]|uniref:zinc dependent phospholipase C family protein n=1 Tax=Anaerocolumna cellulosilytica TaxID=433286 RepID=UPI00160E47A4|nr:zinc dependent phospholipase C family protein [Anaerocolumna cellulosilytica]MBB5196828.1 putative ATP-dependent Lon-type protease [Anaerocolumna cellulosilytica]
MRKKSHISLAKYLIKSMNVEGLFNHKKSFYIGSILPDCVPSFITRRHTIDETFEILENEIKKITDDYEAERGLTRYYTRHLGVITHYIADYFTYPHNRSFTGTMKEHCLYERDLKFALKEYVKSEDAIKARDKSHTMETVEEILQFIRQMHEEYLKVVGKIKNDCMYIVELCHKVVDAILKIFEFNYLQLGIGEMEAA